MNGCQITSELQIVLQMKRCSLILSLLFFTVFSFAQNPLQDLLIKNKQAFGDILDRPAHYETQIIYTQIDRDSVNVPSFTSFEYGVNTDQYFYPASTVKFPTALVALEKLNQLKVIGLDENTPMRTDAGSPPQTKAFTDATSENVLPSIAHYIKKIFLVSDNDAYNRLYEFVGQEQLNKSLRDKGFTDTRLIHRLSEPGYDSLSNQYTNPVTFYTGNKILYHQGEVQSKAPPSLKLENEIKGKGYENNVGKIIAEPFDFRNKNYCSLRDLHALLQTTLFPESVPINQRFDLTESDYQILYQYMSQHPREGQYPYFDQPDGYVKFFLFGGNEEKIPDHIRIFNKVGDAYGYLTDVAYVIDLKNNIEFMIAATIHVNDNRIYNDGVYEYETKGFPFFKKIGQLVYEYELGREREYPANLNRFRNIDYK